MEDALNEPMNIWVAASDGNLTRVMELLMLGESINSQDENGYSPIHAAVSYGHKDLLEYLLSNGADLHLRDNDGDTPILMCEDVEIFKYLIDRGANPADINSLSETLLDKAIEDQNESFVSFLVSNSFFAAKRQGKLIDRIEEGDEEDDCVDAEMEEDDYKQS